MKTGFRTAGFAAWGLGPALRAIREIGFDTVELCLEHPGSRPEMMDETRIGRVRKMLEELELGLSSVSYHGDGSPPEEREARTLRGIDIAARMGAGVLVINTDAKNPALPGQMEATVDRLKRFCEAAEKRGVDLAVEPEPGLVIESSADLQAVVGRVGSPRLKMNLDVGHAFITDPDLLQTIRRMGTMIVHTHVEDIAGRVHRHLLPGEGEIDLAAVAAELRRAGFAGSLTIDLFNPGDQPDVAARAAFEALARVLESAP